MKKAYILFFIAVCACSCGKRHYIGMDYRVFCETIAEELAEAVINEDIDDIHRIVIENNVPVDFQDPEYGNTVLMTAVMNRKAKSVEALLKLGADPNLCSDSTRYSGENSMVLACQFCKTSEIPKLLIKYGGKANCICSGYDGPTRRYSTYPLLEAVSFGDLEMVKVLVEAGANVNGEDYKDYPLTVKLSIIHDKMDITLYLLEQGANYDCDFGSDYQKDHLNIMDLLRKSDLDIGSEEYKYKLKVINFLESRGMNYHDTPIPSDVIKTAKSRHPFTWKEYLEKY